VISRIVLAVDDSPPSLAAARLAIDLARGWNAEITAVFVSDDRPPGDALLGFVQAMANDANVRLTTIEASGQPFEVVLDEARRRDADLIVMGRSDRRRPGSPYVGTQTEHVLEFTDRPVLVVPPDGG
jgi:nucleotide-binding universal stress UspA family protein